MSERTEKESKLTLRKPGRLELKKTVEGGQVRQSFSHGRTKTVEVEVKKKRTFEREAGGRMRAVEKPGPQLTVSSAEAAQEVRDLTEKERAARLRAVEGAAADEERRRDVMAKREADEAARRLAQEEALRRAAEEEEARKRAEEEKAKKRAEDEKARRKPSPAAPAVSEPVAEPEEAEDRTSRRGKQRPEKAPPARPRQEPRRRAGKLTITQALDGDDEVQRGRSVAAMRRAREKEKQRQRAADLDQPKKKVVREVVVPETITVSDLANRMAERGAEVVKMLMKNGVMATINQSIDADTAELVVTEFGHKIKRVSEADVEIGIEGDEDKTEEMLPRAPVVTVMGHVDHGKTSLLDALRETDVAAGEAGGITQHIGAYRVTLSDGHKITFLDTPGHEAFTNMRARGAQATDIVVLVVAADDGVQPQTIEAIRHAQAAQVPIIVAINKMDRPDADPNRVRNELLQHEIVVEGMGGDVLDVEVSATKKTNLDKLEEAILLQSELLELKANPERGAQGTVVEARQERGRGSVATVLVQRGTLGVGDVFIAGAEWGRVRALMDDHGRSVEEAGPSMPVEVLGFQGTPAAGDDFVVVADEARAREITAYRQRQEREKRNAASGRGTLEQMFTQIKEGTASELPVVVKADAQGSVEAIAASFDKLSTDEVKVRMLHGAVGGITESDVTLARASGGVIIAFNVRANPQAREMAKRDGVDIRYYSIIYDALDDIKAMLSGLLAPELRENFLGYAEIREVFNITRVGKVAGCYVTEGVVKRGAGVRLLRDDVVVHEGKLKTLKRFKDEVREVQHGYECGMAFENYDEIKQGDVIECFEVEEITRAL
ncbi:MAG: translation initiation factor IF-2 [Rhodospirillales bacterium]|nr:MAG: translation initiation factor IF-2 [Rhodospirillales bacterium]